MINYLRINQGSYHPYFIEEKRDPFGRKEGEGLPKPMFSHVVRKRVGKGQKRLKKARKGLK